MVYAPVLVCVYVIRFFYAAKGYLLIFARAKKKGGIKYPKFLIFQLAFAAATVASGLINGNITFGILYSVFVWIGITNYTVNSMKTDLDFLKTVDAMYKFLILATLFLAVFFPASVISQSYDGTRIVDGFFGGKNALSMYLLTGLCVNLLGYELEKKKALWRACIYPLICALLLGVSGSGTGLVAAAVFVVLLYLKLYRLLNARNIFIAEIIATFSIVIFRVQEKLFSSFIVNTLHRDVTLTFRADIWEIAVEKFTQNWLLGWGFGNDVIAVNLKLPSWFPYTITETHNGFLDVALALGIAGLVPFILLLFGIVREYDKCGSKTAQIMKLYFCAYSVVAVTECAFTLSRMAFWSMLFIGLAVMNMPAEAKQTDPGLLPLQNRRFYTRVQTDE